MERINALIVGAPRKGKSYYCERQLISYANSGGCACVYNVGRPADFADFLEVEILTPRDVVKIWQQKVKGKIPAYKHPSEITFFRYDGGVYHLKDFSRMFAGKCVKIERIFETRAEGLFFEAIYKYFWNTFLVLDDVRAITRIGLSSELCQLLSRANHAGKLAENPACYGVDIACVFHGFDSVNVEVYQFLNTVIQFQTAYPPELRSNKVLERVLVSNYRRLNQSPPYTRIEYEIFNNKNLIFHAK